MLDYLTKYKYNSQRIIVGFFVGIMFGLLFKDLAVTLQPLGQVFLNLITMLVVPVIFFSITSGISSIGDVQSLKRIGGKVVLVYVLMTVLAGGLGILWASILKPGVGFTLSAASTFDASKVTIPNFSGFLLSLFPKNIVKSMADGDVLQLLVFTVILGISMVILGDKAKMLKDFVEQGANVTYKMLELVMLYAPIGIFALMANTVATYGSQLFGAIFKFISAVWLGDLSVWIILSLFTVAYTGINQKFLYKSMVPIWINTLATTSSAGTIPITLRVATKVFRIPNSIASFSIPLGATINLTGAALWKPVLAIFVANMLGINFTVSQFLLIIAVTTLMSIAAPGIPGGGIVTGAIFLEILNLPIEIMGVIAGMYRLLDMANTTVNVSGDVLGTMIVAKSEKIWDPKKIDYSVEQPD